MATAAAVPEVTNTAKLVAQAIVNIFETGLIRGKYGQVTLLPNDSGHLTYGRSQTTLASGNLFLLLRSYCTDAKAQYSVDLSAYLDRLAKCDLTLDNDLTFRNLLRRAGDDPEMKRIQDDFFDRIYWMPALANAAKIRITSALGVAVVYDSVVHGSWGLVSNSTIQKYGNPDSCGENSWVEKYVECRREWLANHPNPLLHRTVYRMDAFRQLIQQQKWDLELPIVVLGRRIDESLLTSSPPLRVSAEGAYQRVLRLQSPILTGDDVIAVQKALLSNGVVCPSNGRFDKGTEAAVRQYQTTMQLRVDGIVGPATRTMLGLN